MNIKFNTKPNMILLIISVVLLITVFLPWWSASYMGFTVGSINGFHSGGILTFIMSLAGIALAFLDIPNTKYKVLATIGVGILALLGVIIAFLAYGGSSMGWGRIIALIASVALMVFGFYDARKLGVNLGTKSSSAPPPPPPAPPAK